MRGLLQVRLWQLRRVLLRSNSNSTNSSSERLQRLAGLRFAHNEAIRDLQRDGEETNDAGRKVLCKSVLRSTTIIQPLTAPQPPKFPLDQLGISFSNCYDGARQDPEKDMMMLQKFVKMLGGWPSLGTYDVNTPAGGTIGLAVILSKYFV